VSWRRWSTVEEVPADAVGEAVAKTVTEILAGASVELAYSPAGAPLPAAAGDPLVATATGAGPDGWNATLILRMGGAVAPLMAPESASLMQLLRTLPEAALAAAARFGSVTPDRPLSPPLRRALRDTVATEILAHYQSAHSDLPATTRLIAEIVEYLIELSGSRVEAHDLTHGVIVTDVLADTPRLRFRYPADLRRAKRAPLLFDGVRSVLLVDRQGRARTELQAHRLDRLLPAGSRQRRDEVVEGASLVADATERMGGIGFFLRADRTIWTFLDGQPLLVRRGEHWTAFPLELAASIAHMIGGGAAARLVVDAAFMISGQRGGAILAIVDDPARLDGIVSPKDRYDLRNSVDPMAMRIETRLHHLIDAGDLDEHTLARLAALDGATILDRDARLLAYGAVVASADSEHEGARTAAAKTLSKTAEVVLKVSTDGDITVFHQGRAIVTLLGPNA
jgi:hypothetical protein